MKEDDDFYHSQDWKEERERVLEDWDGACEICGLHPRSPHVHHIYGLRYRAYSILCPDCHAELHGKDEIRFYGK